MMESIARSGAAMKRANTLTLRTADGEELEIETVVWQPFTILKFVK